MRPVLITNHKGGVGKTFVAVHLAQCLAEKGNQVLLVDCDGQYDAFNFFARRKPSPNEVHDVSLRLRVLANEQCIPLKKLNYDETSADYVILDSDARLADAAKNISANKIDLVLAPVNFQSLSIENLEDLFITVARVQSINSPFEDFEPLASPGDEADEGKLFRKMRSIAKAVAAHVLVVPLAANEEALEKKLKEYRVKTKVRMFANMPWLPDQTDYSLVRGVPIWQVPGLASDHQALTKQYFQNLAKKLDEHFGA